MDHFIGVGASASVRCSLLAAAVILADFLYRSGALPRVASSSKDATVRVWNAKSRTLQFTLGSHTASVNVVRWGGEGVIYTASSDRTVKLWDGKDVSSAGP